MNQERQKTDAIADAVEIPGGATHFIAHEYITYHKKIGSFWYEITPTGNVITHPFWIHLLQPL